MSRNSKESEVYYKYKVCEELGTWGFITNRFHWVDLWAR